MYKQIDHVDLAEKIALLLGDEKLRAKLGEESRKAVLEICDLEKTMKEWETIYRELVESAKHKSTM
jgi:glycosyltransferase involved in cell wall biosynthesis